MADQPDVPVDDKLIDQLLEIQESPTFETKRVGDNRRKLETVVSFANSKGGFLVLGIEDPQKASGRSRVYGIQENEESVDEFRPLLVSRITPPLAEPYTKPALCRVRENRGGKPGTLTYFWRIALHCHLSSKERK